MSNGLARIGEIVAKLSVTVIDLENRTLSLDDLVAIDVLDFWRFPAHSNSPKLSEIPTAILVPESSYSAIH